MTRTLKTLLAKLKRRRKSQSAPLARNGSLNDRPGKERLAIIEGLADLTVSDPPTTTPPLECQRSKMVSFGSSYEFDFTFKPESSFRWPGPQYDRRSKFAPGVFDKARPTRPKAKQKSSKRKLSSEGRQSKLRPKEIPIMRAVREVPRNPRPIHYYGRLPPREPPHTLLNLPGEIRNQIYRMLCVSSEPLVAQFRPIIRPKRGQRSCALPLETTKRFPREPTLAMVSRQLMGEVLSIFYSENTFMFRRSEEERFKGLVMTHAPTMRKWAAPRNLADSLRSLEVHFTVHPTGGGKDTIIYTFRKLADGSIQISNNADTVAPNSCTCFDLGVVNVLKKTLEITGSPGDLLTEAAKLPIFRTERLAFDTTMLCSGLAPLYRSKKLTCDDCGLITLRTLETGL